MADTTITIPGYINTFSIIIVITIILIIIALFLLYRNYLLGKLKKKEENTIEIKQQEPAFEWGEIEKKPKEKSKIKSITTKISKKLKKEKELETPQLPLEDTKIKPHNYKNSISFFSFKRFKEWFKNKFMFTKMSLIRMELINGFHRSFTVIEKEDGFTYLGRKYLFDPDSKYYDVDSKFYCYDYHQSFTLPFKRSFPINEVKSTLESTEISEVEYAVNPSTLERFINAKIAEGIMKGQALDEMLRRLFTLAVIATVVGVIHLLIFMFKSGMFESVKGGIGLG